MWRTHFKFVTFYLEFTLQSCLSLLLQLLKIGPALKQLKEARDKSIEGKLRFDLQLLHHFVAVGRWYDGPDKYWQMFHTVVQVYLLFGTTDCALELSENANELLEALKHEDDDEILILLGRHVIEQHDECDSIKQKFADYVHKSGNYLLRSQ